MSAPAITQPSRDLAAVLARARTPLQPPPMPSASLRVRATTSPALRRLMPTRVALARAARKGATAWGREAERAQALATMRAVLAGTPRAHEIEALAREHLIVGYEDRALFWRPWPVPDLDERSREHLGEALASGRGVLLSSCHLGPYFLTSRVFTLLLERMPFSIFGPWFFQPPSHDYWGRRLARWWRNVHSVALESTGSFPTLRALLEHGQTVYLFFDMPGHRQTRFLGKPAMLADGSARLACAADALVLGVRVRRVGTRPSVDFSAPLDPREHAGMPELLHDALAQLHERWILEQPAAMDDPANYGWGQAASATAWERPGPA